MHTVVPTQKLEELLQGKDEQTAKDYFDTKKEQQREQTLELDEALLGENTPKKKLNKFRQKSVSLPSSPFEMEGNKQLENEQNEEDEKRLSPIKEEDDMARKQKTLSYIAKILENQKGRRTEATNLLTKLQNESIEDLPTPRALEKIMLL